MFGEHVLSASLVGGRRYFTLVVSTNNVRERCYARICVHAALSVCHLSTRFTPRWSGLYVSVECKLNVDVVSVACLFPFRTLIRATAAWHPQPVLCFSVRQKYDFGASHTGLVSDHHL